MNRKQPETDSTDGSEARDRARVNTRKPLSAASAVLRRLKKQNNQERQKRTATKKTADFLQNIRKEGQVAKESKNSL